MWGVVTMGNGDTKAAGGFIGLSLDKFCLFVPYAGGGRHKCSGNWSLVVVKKKYSQWNWVTK